MVQQAEGVVGYTNGRGGYMQVQWWWHQLRLWGIPAGKWGVLENLAKAVAKQHRPRIQAPCPQAVSQDFPQRGRGNHTFYPS